MTSRVLSLLLPAVFMCTLAHAETVTIPSRVEYADGADVRQAVKDECELQTLLPEYIADNSEDDLEIVMSDNAAAASGKVLQLQITYVLAPGGGAFSGPKSVTVRGELVENGEVLGSFTAVRYSSRGNRTCSILNRCVRTIGSDIAEWLQDPTMDAKLGNA